MTGSLELPPPPEQKTQRRLQGMKRQFGLKGSHVELYPVHSQRRDPKPERIRLDFYDVLNTRENGQDFTPPAEEEIVLAHSWCGTREEIGRPEFEASLCP